MSTAENAPPAGRSKTLAKALDIIDVIAASGPVSLASLDRRIDLPKATMHRLLAVLAERNVVVVDEDGDYRLGPYALRIGASFLQGLDLRAEAGPALSRLSESTGEVAVLGVRDGARVVYIERTESPHSVQMRSRVGSTNPLYCSALGKAILAFSEEEVIEEVITQGLSPRAPRTIAEPAALRAELASIREAGVAYDDEENEEGLRGVGAPIWNHLGRVTAGLSLAGPKFRIDSALLERYAQEVIEAASDISQRLGHQT